MMEKPDVDSIDGLSPAISIDQKTTSRNPRSTVGTVTEIYDYLHPALRARRPPALPRLRAPDRRQSLDQIVEQILALPEGRSSPSTRPSCATARASSATCSTSSAPTGSRASRWMVRRGCSRRRSSSTRSSSTRSTSSSTGSSPPTRPAPAAARSVETAAALADGLVAVDVIDGEGMLSREVRLPGARRLCPSCSRGSSPSTRRTAPARAAPGSARSSRSTPI